MLPIEDARYLQDRFPEHQVVAEGGMLCVVIPGWPLPSGFSVGATDLLLRLSPGYPDVPPDMWWMAPAVTLATGAVLPATDQRETYLQRTWQRWSRHLPAGAWQLGIDGLQNYLAQIRTELERSVGLAA